MKQWLAEYWVGSNISTVAPGERHRYIHPEGAYSVIIRDGKSEYNEECELVAQIIVSAPALNEAADKALRAMAEGAAIVRKLDCSR